MFNIVFWLRFNKVCVPVQSVEVFLTQVDDDIRLGCSGLLENIIKNILFIPIYLTYIWLFYKNIYY